MDVKYRLAESYVTVAGPVEYESDDYVNEGMERRRQGTSSATVSVGLRADRSTDLKIVIGEGSTDDDYSVMTTTDGRVTGFTFKAVGIGGRLIGAAASLVAFVGGIAASIGQFAAQEQMEAGAEDAARAAWRSNYADEAALLDGYKPLVAKTAKAAMSARIKASDPTSPDRYSEGAEARRLDAVGADVRRELDRIEALYQAWRAKTKRSRTEERTYDLGIGELPADGGATPEPSRLSAQAKRVWDDLGVVVQVGPPDSGEMPTQPGPAPYRNPWVPDYLPRDPEAAIEWRVARPARIWIWRRNTAGEPELSRTYPAWVVDASCPSGFFELDSRLFGEDSGEIQFGDLGMPTKFVRAEKGAPGILADALAKVPEQVAGGLEFASKSYTAAASLFDAQQDHELAALKRQVELAQKRLEQKGLEATSEDYALAARLEQQAAMAEARKKIAPTAAPTELATLTEQRSIIEAQAAIATTQRAIALDTELASVRAEVARLEARVALEELRSK